MITRSSRSSCWGWITAGLMWSPGSTGDGFSSRLVLRQRGAIMEGSTVRFRRVAMREIRVGVAGLLLAACTAAPAADKACVSGPRAGQRPGPYSFVLSTGDQRGKSHCYICETADRPAVIVFAR